MLKYEVLEQGKRHLEEKQREFEMRKRELDEEYQAFKKRMETLGTEQQALKKNPSSEKAWLVEKKRKDSKETVYGDSGSQFKVDTLTNGLLLMPIMKPERVQQRQPENKLLEDQRWASLDARSPFERIGLKSINLLDLENNLGRLDAITIL